MEECQYSRIAKIPPLAYFKIIREISIIMHLYSHFTDVIANFVLPKHTAKHPVIMRLRSSQF